MTGGVQAACLQNWARDAPCRDRCGEIAFFRRYLASVHEELTVYRPPLSVLALQQIVRLGTVGHATGGAVVVDSLADPVCDQAEEHLLDERAAVIGIARGLEVALARSRPFLEEVFDRAEIGAELTAVGSFYPV